VLSVIDNRAAAKRETVTRHPERQGRQAEPQGTGCGTLCDSRGHACSGQGEACGEFSLDLPALATVEGPAPIINPRRLQQATKDALTAYLEKLDGAETERLLKRLRRYFQAEIDLAAK
jgi:hypothetical protein